MPEALDLFSAACGGWSLGLHRAGFRTIAACEAVDWRRILYAQNKTGEPLTIPAHSALRKHLAAIRTNFGGPIVRGQDGAAMNANQLSSAMNRALAKVEGMPRRSLHGLRYAAAGALEEVGCSVVEISAIVGHRTYQMAMKYARQRKDAVAAMARLENRA